jgi:hypothetical protein
MSKGSTDKKIGISHSVSCLRFINSIVTMATVTLEQFNPANFEPIPLPDHLPTYELPRVSISKLMGKDEAETKTVVDICARTGFFLLNLMDHPLGRNLWESACKLRNLGQHIMATLPEEDKKLFLQREERGVLDRGYTSSARDGQGVAKFVESINVVTSILAFTAWLFSK